MIELLLASWQVMLVIVAIIGAAVWLRSQLVKQRTQELEKLANTRGDRINDLEKKQKEMENTLAEMRGELEFLRKLKTKEIAEAAADEVVERLLPFLTGT